MHWTLRVGIRMAFMVPLFALYGLGYYAERVGRWLDRYVMPRGIEIGPDGRWY